ncbi:hypothetical protein ST47_g7051 [Ascochyta rabiei]|uniref:Uncharacterized protein n=1 Tax=Didymella rabiei TaxID=5454 RepID=A0A163BEJ5_DIDRA|nr:hypothetical protein ST47_g7051 [Ascochyta rabiei]
MATPQKTTTLHGGELHHTVSNTSTAAVESPEPQSSKSSGRSNLSHSTPVPEPTVTSESPESPNSTPPSAPRPSKRVRTTRVKQVSTSSTPYTVGSAQKATQVATRTIQRLVIRMLAGHGRRQPGLLIC